jgi:XTP/dITP diphosphohydrolase
MLPQTKSRISFATENLDKISEANQILSEFKINLEQANVKKVEIQAEQLEEIVTFALNMIPNDALPIIIEDSGLFIDALNGFPGPYSSFVYKKIRCEGVIKLMEGRQERKAIFISVVGYKSKEKRIFLFRGEIYGNILSSTIGKGGFGFDPIFVPDENDKTFAQMNIEEKNSFSHRGKAFRKWGEWMRDCQQNIFKVST